MVRKSVRILGRGLALLLALIVSMLFMIKASDRLNNAGFVFAQNEHYVPSKPSQDLYGTTWPEKAPIKDISDITLTDSVYRRVQMPGNLDNSWRNFMMVSLLKENPEVCVLPPILHYDNADKPVITNLNIIADTVNECQRNNKTYFVGPIYLLGETLESGHANLLFLNSTSKTLERMDPNGNIPYPSEKLKDGFATKALEGNLQVLSRRIGYKAVTSSTFPVQLIEIIDDTSTYDGYCEAWVYWLMQTKLLNQHLSPDELNRRILRRLEENGKEEIIGFIKANLQRYKQLRESTTLFERQLFHNTHLNENDIVPYDVAMARHEVNKLASRYDYWRNTYNSIKSDEPITQIYAGPAPRPYLLEPPRYDFASVINLFNATLQDGGLKVRKGKGKRRTKAKKVTSKRTKRKRSKRSRRR